MNKLPILSLELEKIFTLFKMGQILDIFKYLLLEEKIIVFSTDKNTLSAVIEGFTSLLYPFNYVFPFTTILPMDNIALIENFPTYFVGINSKYDINFFKNCGVEINDISLLIIDVDGKKIIYHNPDYLDLNIISLKKFNESFNPVEGSSELPKHYRAKLIEKIQDYIREIKENTSKKEDRDSFIRNIRDIFFSFIIGILQEYGKYVISSEGEFENVNDIINSMTNIGVYKELSINDIFKTEEFLNNVATKEERHFYKKLIETKMFYKFIYKKLFPKDNKDKMDIILFDEYIIEKYNKRLFSKTVY